jgi:radical SAM enzyme (TIGR01210 family)
MMAASDAELCSFETRAETITDESLAHCRIALGSKPLKVYLGLESANAWVTKYCVNKEMPVGEYERASETLRVNGIGCTANIIVGSPFLSPAEVIEDAVSSVNWAMQAGATECCLFPVHVKRWTSLHWFYMHGLYTPVSLWSYVEVLRRLGAATTSSSIELAWYTSYGAPNVVWSPTTCAECYPQVIEGIHRFAETNNFDWVERVTQIECACKDAWRVSLADSPHDTVLERVARGYERIGRELLGDAFWSRHGPALRADMESDLVASPAPPLINAEREMARSVR